MPENHCNTCKWQVEGYCHCQPPGALTRVIRDEDHPDLKNYPQVDPDVDGPCEHFVKKPPRP